MKVPFINMRDLFQTDRDIDLVLDEITYNDCECVLYKVSFFKAIATRLQLKFNDRYTDDEFVAIIDHTIVFTRLSGLFDNKHDEELIRSNFSIDGATHTIYKLWRIKEAVLYAARTNQLLGVFNKQELNDDTLIDVEN